jgi:hypothetical protein
MSRLTHHTATASPRLFSTSGTFGEVQIVATPRSVVLDIQSRTRDCDGYERCHYALANLSLNEVHRLRDLLSEAIIVAESADARQPGLWSETTTRAVAYRLDRGGRA